ncbi:MAG: thiamine diphosphokinase, partial [Victivallales bacterium]|nr:thiamine diphosphokinase [Victivallales bacterium]
MDIILANGEFPQSRKCLQALRDAAHVICCDGAVVALAASRIREPDGIVGDLDSIPEALKERFAERLHHEAEQETNDLAKAFRFCIRQGWTDHLVILGAMGRRDDHAIGNLALLMDFSQIAPDIQLWTDYGCFQVLTRSVTLPSTPGEQLSIFSPDPAMPITTCGLRYPLDAQPLVKLWSGTLNECDGSSFRLHFPGPAPLLLYRPWPRAASKHPLAIAPRLPWSKVHFLGIGGVGVSGLAQILLDAGCEVSGSDAQDSAFAQRLRAQGADISIGHRAENLPADAELVVYSAAVPATNPERQEAFRLGIPQCRRGQFLARLAPYFRRVVAISGSHGKTTTTAMLAHILRKRGVNPGYLVGGLDTGWKRSAAAGAWEILFTEVDESDRSQELMLPALSIVLNIDDDHCWGIGGTAGLEECFARLAAQSLKTLTWDTPDLRRILHGAPALAALPLAAAEDPALGTLPFHGAHNRQNAAIALAAAELLGVPRAAALEALRTF